MPETTGWKPVPPNEFETVLRKNCAVIALEKIRGEPVGEHYGADRAGLVGVNRQPVGAAGQVGGGENPPGCIGPRRADSESKRMAAGRRNDDVGQGEL